MKPEFAEMLTFGFRSPPMNVVIMIVCIGLYGIFITRK